MSASIPEIDDEEDTDKPGFLRRHLCFKNVTILFLLLLVAMNFREEKKVRITGKRESTESALYMKVPWFSMNLREFHIGIVRTEWRIPFTYHRTEREIDRPRPPAAVVSSAR